MALGKKSANRIAETEVLAVQKSAIIAVTVN